MIYKDNLLHPSFSQPENVNYKVWRYISLSKLIDLFITNELFLSRIDYLNDSHEGTFTKLNSNLLRRNPLENNTGESSEQKWKVRQTTFANCWRLDQFESVAMWRIYCMVEEGVAIQTTYKKLIESLPDDKNLFIGCVKYLDYESETFDVSNIYNAIMHKRIAFNFENEIRIVKKNWYSNQDYELFHQSKGFKIEVDLLKNIENIYVNPEAPEWYYNTVMAISKKFNLDIPIVWSGLKSIPYQ